MNKLQIATYTNPLLMVFGFLVLHDLIIYGVYSQTYAISASMLEGKSDTFKDWALLSDQLFGRLWMSCIALLLMARVGLFTHLGLAKPVSTWTRKPSFYLFLVSATVVQTGFPNVWYGLSEYTSLMVLFSMLGDMAIGIEEELWFRGVAFLVLLRGWSWAFGASRRSVLAAIFVSSALFGIWHLTNYVYGQPLPETCMQVIYTFLLGIIFACLYIFTGSIWAPIIGHGVFDFGVSISIVFNRGGEDVGSVGTSDQTFAEAFAAYGGFIALVAVIAVLSLRYLSSIEPELRKQFDL